MLETGQHIDGRYEVEALVGQGGLAEVYRVRHLQLGSIHALKLLLFRKKSLADRLLLEGRIQAQLKHPNVVSVTDVVRHEGQYGLLMEYVDELSLEDLLEDRQRLPVDEALDVFAPILAGVHAAHLAGVLHRDLKPSNVLLSRNRGGLVPKVADFGIAKVVAEQLEGATAEGVTMGTPGYMAPEQVIDARSVDERTDVFALAAILYELVTGRRAFAAEDGSVSLRSTLEGTFLPMSELVEGVPDAICLAVQKAMSREREERYATVLDFARDLFSDRPDVLAVIEGTGVARPISLDTEAPARPRLVSGPGTAIEFGAFTAESEPEEEPAPSGPTLAPLTAMHGDTVVSDGAPPTWGEPGASTILEERRRRGVPPFWTGVGLSVGLVLVGAVVAVLVIGPGLGWMLAPVEDAPAGEAATARADEVGVGRTPVADADGATEVEDVGEDDAAGQDSVAAASADEAPVGEAPAVAPAGNAVVAAVIAEPEPDVGDGEEEGGKVGGETSQDGVDAGADADGAEAIEVAEPTDDGVADAADAGSSEPQDPEPVDATPAVIEPLVPEPPPPVMPMDTFLKTSWSGKVFRQPFQLQDLRQESGQVKAEGVVIQGAIRRTFPLIGRFDPQTGTLYLRESNGDLIIEGKVSDDAIRGLYRREGKDADPLVLTRR